MRGEFVAEMKPPRLSAAEPQPGSGWPLSGRLFNGPFEGEAAKRGQELRAGAWKEFETEWKVTLLDSQGRALGTAQTNLEVRAEGAPAAFLIQLGLPQQGGLSPSAPGRVSVEGTVRRLSGAYHGHGLWLRFGGGD